MIGQNVNRTKHLNRYLVLKTVYQYGPISRLAISKITHLAAATISNITSELISDGILVETDRVASHGRVGRREILIDVNADGRYVIGVHIGRKILSCSVINLKGEILQREDHLSEDQSVDETIALIEAFVRKLTVNPEKVLGIALGVNGWVDFFSGTVNRRPDERWANVPLVELVQRRTGARVVMDNNVVGMSLAEKLMGLGKPLNNMLFLYADVGVGAGLISNGVPYRFGPVNVGHISIRQDSDECWCGSVGCVELFAGTDNIRRKVQSLYPQYFANGDMDISDLIALEHVPEIRGVFQEVGASLGIGLTNTMNVLSVPDVIACGRIFDSEVVWNELNHVVAKRVITGPVTIQKSAYGVHEIGVLGAGSLGLYHFVLVGGLPDRELMPYI
ncbi:ROK family protein [Alicyclobacillus shizuokensis]|uniref:ROK family protein n=1 Tax=Alicyclobacillus shizuokensis TaxID=392014 RepID=UPI00082D4ECC|nr:ROK family protein [Alicyclobacillus shizuokensis]MCL6625760.1 ROK family protein [Alicyclobacillus shizuokensis]